MNKPIIDPSILSEGQREAIRDEYVYNAQMLFNPSYSKGDDEVRGWHQGKCHELEHIFGSDFFKKGE